jgi:hypothetical protein
LIPRPGVFNASPPPPIPSDKAVRDLLNQILTAAHAIQGQPLNEARSVFFDLSRPLLVYLQQDHASKECYYRYFCPMAKKGWVQQTKEIRNPYYGSSMLICGEPIQ